MRYIKNMTLTASQAKEMVHLGFVLKFIKSGVINDEYQVYVLEGK